MNCQDKDTMKKRKLNHRKSRKINKRKQSETLKPKGMESDHNGCTYIMGNGQTIFGLQVASKVFKKKIMHDVELGKPNMLPKGQELRKE